MPLRIELSADVDRGPGFGVLRVHGLPPGDGTVSAVIQRNQGTTPFLGDKGLWEMQSVEHKLPPARLDADGAWAFDLGSDLVDPLALLARNTKVLMTLRTSGGEDKGVLAMRQLFPSLASGTGAPSGPAAVTHELHAPAPEPVQEFPAAPESHERPERIEPTLEAPPPPPEAPVIVTADDRPFGYTDGAQNEPRRGPKLWIILLGIGLVILLAAGTGFALWQMGLFDRSDTLPPVTGTPSSTPDGKTKEIGTREDLAAYIGSNPAAADAYATGKALAQKGKLDFAMLVFNYASRAGSTDAALALAHMYDPETWSKETSPMPQADAETAAYWYEPAAVAGNVEAQRQLGKILLSLSPSGPQHDKGIEWLGKAAVSGDAKAKETLDAARK